MRPISSDEEISSAMFTSAAGHEGPEQWPGLEQHQQHEHDQQDVGDRVEGALHPIGQGRAPLAQQHAQQQWEHLHLAHLHRYIERMGLPAGNPEALAEQPAQQRHREDRQQGGPHLQQPRQLMVAAQLEGLAHRQRRARAEGHQGDGGAFVALDAEAPRGLQQQQAEQGHEHAGSQQHAQGHPRPIQPAAQHLQPQAQAQGQHRAQQGDGDEQADRGGHGSGAGASGDAQELIAGAVMTTGEAARPNPMASHRVGVGKRSAQRSRAPASSRARATRPIKLIITAVPVAREGSS